MNNEEIKKARKEYARRKKEKDKLIALKEEFEQLKKDPKVKRYLEICDIENKQIPMNEDLIRYSFFKFDQTDEEFKIYLYMGAYQRAWNFDEYDNQILDRSKADYLLYCNIADQNDSIQIKPSMQEQFERENIVFKTKSILGTESKYYELQKIYYEYLLTCDLRKKGKVLEKIKEHL